MVTQAHAFLCRIHCAHVLIAMLFSTVVWPRMQSLYNGWRMHGADARSVPVQHALHRLAWFQLCARRWYAPDSLPMTLQRVLADHLNAVCRFAHATVLHGCAMGPPAVDCIAGLELARCALGHNGITRRGPGVGRTSNWARGTARARFAGLEGAARAVVARSHQRVAEASSRATCRASAP